MAIMAAMVNSITKEGSVNVLKNGKFRRRKTHSNSSQEHKQILSFSQFLPKLQQKKSKKLNYHLQFSHVFNSIMVFLLKPRLGKVFLLLLLSTIFIQISLVNCRCGRVCDLAFASFTVWRGSDLTLISQLFDTTINEIRRFNPQIPDQDTVIAGTAINIPFSCDCIRNEYLGHIFNYTVQSGDTYERVSSNYSNLTTVASLQTNNSYPPTNIPDNAFLNVIVNCYCGDRDINQEYGLFITYPVKVGDTLQSVAAANNLTTDVIRSYNPPANLTSGNGIIFIPGKDENGSYRPITSSTGLSGGAIAGIVIGVVGGLFLAGCLYMIIYRKKKVQGIALLSITSDQSLQDKAPDSVAVPEGAAPGLTGITVDKSVEFSYEELASATDNFSISNKIGEGGFGAVYYAELRGEKAAIKKMDMQATREFLAELNVLTRVHHLNLVRLIGYCVEGSLFLVYEYIENGNLSQHLRGSGRDPLPWSTRVQIALDSARGLEYIHEHTVPVYIHRDIKSANILIDKSFHAKVADFGLTKLTEVGGSSLPTRLVGTFGYMPPEYAQYGDVSPKIDVYAFGVVLYELISAKEAIVKGSSTAESKGLVGLFEEALNQSKPEDELRKLVDPRLGDGYPLDSVSKMAHLAKVCTHENPQLRPTMRSIVVALMTLSSSTEDWDVGSFYRNQGLVNLMSGR